MNRQELNEEYQVYVSKIPPSVWIKAPRHPFVEFVDSKNFSIRELDKLINLGYHETITKGLRDIYNKSLIGIWTEP